MPRQSAGARTTVLVAAAVTGLIATAPAATASPQAPLQVNLQPYRPDRQPGRDEAARLAINTCFVVYQDLTHYGGVYRHTGTDADPGGHCVAIIDWDDTLGCWICKNSWGPGWDAL